MNYARLASRNIYILHINFVIMMFYLNERLFKSSFKTKTQPYAVDHLARESMKSAANCVN